MVEILTKSGDVQGRRLTGVDGVKLGTVREMFLDLASGRIRFLIVDGGGLLGGTGKFHPVPWSAVRYDSVADAFQAERTKDEFKASPSYDRDQLAGADYAWHEQATRFFAPATWASNRATIGLPQRRRVRIQSVMMMMRLFLRSAPTASPPFVLRKGLGVGD